jgi:hypothetical protein
VKLLGLDIRRNAATPDRPRDEPPGGTAGVENAGIWDFQAGGPDVNPLLSGTAKFGVYDEMAKSNPAVKSTLWAISHPVRAARCELEPAADTPVDRVIADACRWQLGLSDVDGPLDRPWSSVLGQKLLFVRYGAMFEELIWSRDLVDWTDRDGDTHPLRPIRRLAPRFPGTIDQVNVDDETGLTSIKQWLPGARPIPREKLSFHVLDQEGSDYFGTSMLRSMWGPWKLQKELMIAVGIGWDRFATGIPVVRHPAGNPRDETKAQAIARNVRMGERAYVTLPGPVDAGWEFDIVQVNATGLDPVPLLRWYSEQIASAGLQQFSSLGTSQTGSRAVGQVLVQPFYHACQSLADQLAGDIMRNELRRFVTYNFGAEFKTPRLRFSKVQVVDPTVLATVIAELASGGISLADLETQNVIRDHLDLPMLTELPPPLVAEGGSLAVP